LTEQAGPEQAAPGLVRRLAALVYEGLLLFGVLMAAGWLYSGLTQQRHALHGRTGLQFFLFLTLAVYFVWFWTHGGQTVAMKAWRLRVVAANGGPLTQARALARYVLAWLWFLPSLIAIQLSGLHGGAAIGVTLVAGGLAYAATSYLHPKRQFLHDALCGTRIVDASPSPPST
jgi:uncharacterized RDD family membrane protein YckC